MVIETSALVAILSDEPERRAFIEKIEAADVRLLSAASFLETSTVIDARYGPEGVDALDRLIDRAGIDIAPVDEEQAREARQACSRYGKGRHPAGLNFGDCFAYALAITTGDGLLFKGTDFASTDVAIA